MKTAGNTVREIDPLLAHRASLRYSGQRPPGAGELTQQPGGVDLQGAHLKRTYVGLAPPSVMTSVLL